jgi:hypothetical protein
MAKETIALADIVNDAQLDFWYKVAEYMPLAEGGDFDPMSSLDFDLAIEEAIKTWWGWNASTHYDLQLPNGEILEGGE